MKLTEKQRAELLWILETKLQETMWKYDIRIDDRDIMVHSDLAETALNTMEEFKA